MWLGKMERLPMKILYVVTRGEIGGAQTVVLELAKGMVSLGHEVFVMAQDEKGMWELLPREVGKIKSKHLRREISPVHDLKALLEIKSIYSNLKPDIVHLHSSKAGALARLALIRNWKKVVYTVHGFDTILVANPGFLVLEKMLAKFTRKVVAVSEYDRKNLLKNGIKNVVTILNGVAFEDREVENIFSRYAKGRKVIVTVARLFPPKNVKLFLEVAKVMDKNRYAFFWIGNKKPMSGSENVYFLGEIPEAKFYLKHAHLYVLFSDYEGLPVSIIEALSMGCPVVASDVGGVRELLDGRNGMFVKNDIFSWVEAIKRFLEDENFYRKARDFAKKSFEEKFSSEAMVKAYLRLYEEVIS